MVIVAVSDKQHTLSSTIEQELSERDGTGKAQVAHYAPRVRVQGDEFIGTRLPVRNKDISTLPVCVDQPPATLFYSSWGIAESAYDALTSAVHPYEYVVGSEDQDVRPFGH
jgi:hypothetical protein